MINIRDLGLNDYSIALTGCRAVGIGYECCEYDLIVLEDYKESIIYKDDKIFEIHKLSNDKIKQCLQLYNSIILQDNKLILASLISYLDRDILRVIALNELFNILFDLSKAIHSNLPLESSFLLKKGAYNYLAALLRLNKKNLMPLHALSQFKALNIDLTLPLKCLGVEYANSSSLLRAYNVLREFSNLPLINKKIFYLYDNKRYVDCYLYIIYLSLEMVKEDYHDMLDELSILMSLNVDIDKTKQLAKELMLDIKERLKVIKR
jgi:hypothetical protein